jgi:hypothetical protein
MAALTYTPVTEQDLQGFKYFRMLGLLFVQLHPCGTERGHAGNRRLFYDQYATLVLLYFFHPTVTSLRGLQQASMLANVQQRLGVHRASLGLLSEAAQVFDAALLQPVASWCASNTMPRTRCNKNVRFRQLPKRLVSTGRSRSYGSWASHWLSA